MTQFQQPAPPIPRDGVGSGRPLVADEPGAKPTARQRSSTFASVLDNGPGIGKWRGRLIAEGIGKYEDLAALAASSTYGEALLDEVIETAIDRMGGTHKAHAGTAFHRFTDPDASPEYVPARMRPAVEGFQESLVQYGIEIVETETFVVADEFEGRPFRVAGSFDHGVKFPALAAVLGEDPETVYVIDKKSGQFHPVNCHLQLTSYALGERYDHVTQTRSPLNVSQKAVLVAHSPVDGSAGTTWWVLDLDVGRRLVHLALDVLETRKSKTLATDLESFLGNGGPLVPAEPVRATQYRENPPAEEIALPAEPDPDPGLGHSTLLELVARATSEEAIGALYAGNRENWTDEVRELARARKAVLQGGLVVA